MNANAIAEQAIASQVEKATSIIENQLDAEIDRLDRLDDDDLDALRRERLAQMSKAQKARDEHLANGHGKYFEVADEPEFFAECKRSKNVVCHFYRDGTERCKIVDKHLDLLAPKHIEAKFIKINAEKAMFLSQRLKVRVIPTIVILRDNKTVDFIVGFDELGGHDEFSTEMLAWRLGRADAIHYAGDLMTPPDEQNAKTKNILTQGRKTIRGQMADDSDDDEDF